MESDRSETTNSNDSDSDMNLKSCENSGWVDSIAKILKSNKAKRKKTLVLSKGKKISDTNVKRPPKLNFEVETISGEIKPDFDIKVEENEVVKTDKIHDRRKKRELPILRVKPNVLYKDRERTLCKIATKGVVQLFNAIKTQQSDTKNKLEQAGSLEIKKNKVLKNVDKKAFLDMLMSEQSESVANTERIISKDEKKPWNVLRDDFMVGAKLKDWDKELEKEEELEYE